MVPVALLQQRRANYRRMTEQQKAALEASMGRFGFKTFILVAPVEGGFEVLDGHHRWEEAKNQGMENIPAIVLEDPDMDDADLAMLVFNVTAEIIPEVYLDFLRELDLRIGSEQLAAYTALDPGFLKDLGTTLDNVDLSMDLGLENDDGRDRTRGSAINIILPSTPRVRAMLDELRDCYDLDTDAEAVMVALEATTEEPGGSDAKDGDDHKKA